ncbi:hypothetical protein KSP39_PZI015193 [Platanthera zijinensis]|uniref:Uncharacterized protein n=1 Tax=Platanthera zijinensis TaxID=2320716 RepID=A0AAP0B8F3_9ASPA
MPIIKFSDLCQGGCSWRKDQRKAFQQKRSKRIHPRLLRRACSHRGICSCDQPQNMY